MTEPHDAPSVEQMVDAVREWLEIDVVGNTEGRLRFHARVAANMLGMVARELELGAAQAAAHRARLDELGVDDDAALASAIREGRIGADQRVRELLRAAVVDKLAVANPRYLRPEDRPDPA